MIAEAFYLAKDIERWGSGLRRIKEECDVAGVKVVFEKVSTGFQVTFYRSEAEITPRKAEKSEGLSEGLKSLREVIKLSPGIKAKDLSPRLAGRPIKTIERQIKTLIERNLIERRGSRKTGGYWEVIKG